MTTQDYFSGAASPKALAFVADLVALCERHGVVLSTSDYDALQVWNRTATDPAPIHAPFITDMTT